MPFQNLPLNFWFGIQEMALVLWRLSEFVFGMIGISVPYESLISNVLPLSPVICCPTSTIPLTLNLKVSYYNPVNR